MQSRRQVFYVCVPIGLGLCGVLAARITHRAEHVTHESAAHPSNRTNEAPSGMVWIPSGSFRMGSDIPAFADAQPLHRVDLDGFWLDATPITNSDYEKFVKATGYTTIAELKPDPADFPGVAPERLVPGSLVFKPPQHAVPLDDVSQWWAYVPGACWRHPEGPGSIIEGREDHPAVQICYKDAAAYAKWRGKRLPTEAEFEYAARGGLDQAAYVWGSELRPGGKFMANTFQGTFPNSNSCEDGYERTSPVHAFPPNRFGLYDMAGNVWEWCSDWYTPDYYAVSPRKNPQGPSESYDPTDMPGLKKKVQRGGSFLCSEQYCSRFMPGGRGKGDIDTGSSHIGFRCAMSGASAASMNSQH